MNWVSVDVALPPEGQTVLIMPLAAHYRCGATFARLSRKPDVVGDPDPYVWMVIGCNDCATIWGPGSVTHWCVIEPPKKNQE